MRVDIIGGCCHKYNFCRDKCRNKCFFATNILSLQTRVCCNKHVFYRDKTRLLSWQKYACRNNGFVATNFCCCCRDKYFIFIFNKLTFVTTNTCLSRQNTSFWATKACLSRQNFCRVCRDKDILRRNKHNLVPTKVLPRQAYFCRDKNVFVATKWYLWQLLPMIGRLLWQMSFSHSCPK